MEHSERENYEIWLRGEKAAFMVGVGAYLVPSEQTEENMRVISRAFDFAALCHKDERRDKKHPDTEGEPYIVHPIAVAMILLREGSETTAHQVIVALLHDTIESGDKKIAPGTTKKEIEEKFWTQVAKSVCNLSKKSKLDHLHPLEHPFYHAQIAIDKIFFPQFAFWTLGKEVELKSTLAVYFETELKKRRDKHYFWGVAHLDEGDFRVKVADHIHSLRTLDGCKLEKRQRIIDRAYEIFLPATLDRFPAGHKLILDELVRHAIQGLRKHAAKIMDGPV